MASGGKDLKVFQARKRVLFDLVLILQVIIVILSHVTHLLTPQAYLLIDAGIVGFLVLFWFGAVVPLTRIEMTDQSIKGPGPNFFRGTLLLRKVSLRATNTKSLGWRRHYLYKDVVSGEGQKIRIFRRILGEQQLRKIMTAVECYPDHETL